MDGSAIWKWNRALYLVLFIPLIAFYFFTYHARVMSVTIISGNMRNRL